MPLVINALGGGHTDTRTYRRANKNYFNKPGACSLWPDAPGLKISFENYPTLYQSTCFIEVYRSVNIARIC